jgi:ribosomal protein S16
MDRSGQLIPLPVSARTGAKPTRELMGSINCAESTDECVYFVATGHQDRIPLLWPPGWHLRFNAPPPSAERPVFEIVTEQERPAVRAGEPLALVGWFEPVDSTDPCMLGKHEAFRVIKVIYITRTLEKGRPARRSSSEDM